jgi:ferric-dicitrate binding protein FerR (iron transport regulator)
MEKRNQPETLPTDEAKELWDRLSNGGDDEVTPPTEQEKKEFRQELYDRIEAYEAKKRTRKILRYSSLMVAATLLLIGSIVAYRSLYLPDVYQADQYGLTILLKDGSKAILSKGAKLTVEKSFPSATRDVFLEGDAIFNVTKSKKYPFIVHAGAYQTKVLGTIFKISQQNSSFNVDLYEGKVEVAKSEKPKEVFLLHPLETFSNMGSLKVATVLPTKKGELDTNEPNSNLVFTDLPLSDAVQIIEKMYSVKINYPSERASTAISVNKKNPTPENLLEFIAIQLNLNTNKVNAKTFELEK